MSSYTLNWRGPMVIAKCKAATIIAVNLTMARCVVMAKGLVRVQTATLQGSIRFTPARAGGGGVVGEWGSFDVGYAIYQELGTYKMSAKPYLRPAADFEYGLLGSRIRAAM